MKDYHVKRYLNGVAHRLAKEVISFNLEQGFIKGYYQCGELHLSYFTNNRIA
jgi:hypothetical protein